MIIAEQLCKTFDSFEAVRDLSLDVPSGELLALLGPNGAGKTTTVRMLGAILKPTSGSASINGYDVVARPDAVRRSIGMLTEQPGLYLRMGGLEYLTFYGRLYGMDDDSIRRRSLRLFERFGMAEAATRRLGQYSKGMRQKVGLIRAMLHDPSVLLLDEPTSAMDPHSAKLVRDAILELRAERRAVIVCTHNLAEAELLADRIAIIKQGQIVIQGTPSQLKQELLGQPQMEVHLDRSLNGEIREIEALVQVEWVKDDVLRYRTPAPREVNPQLIRCLDGLGVGVISLREITSSLEDVYLHVVSEQIAGNDAALNG